MHGGVSPLFTLKNSEKELIMTSKPVKDALPLKSFKLLIELKRQQLH